jgi:O-antigen ligase
MSAVVGAGATWPSADWYASRTRRTTLFIVGAACALAIAYATLIVATDGSPLLLAPLAVTLVVGAIVLRPVSGLYLLFAAGLLFEQFEIIGVSPITAQTRIFQNISGYTPIPLRLSIADLLLVLTLASWGLRRLAHRDGFRAGPLAKAVLLYLGAFGVGTVIGVVRGGDWDPSATLAELRGPVYVGVLYFLTADLVRQRSQLIAIASAFVGLVAVKAFQGIVNYFTSPGNLEAVTAHEDVIFFNVALALAVVAVVAGIRTKVSFAILGVTPLILLAELFTERRAGFIGLGVVLIALVVLFLIRDPRRGLAMILIGGLAVSAYVPLFWGESGPIAEPIRALRAALDDPDVTVRDQLSDKWRDYENSNIAYTMRQLPLTGVGLGQEYLFREEPPHPPTSFAYWRLITHNAVLWLWLKAGPLGAFALWFLVMRVLLTGSALWERLRDPNLLLVATMPIALTMCQIVFSSVELGLTYSRTMIVLGITLGLAAPLMAHAMSGVPRVRAAEAR